MGEQTPPEHVPQAVPVGTTLALAGLIFTALFLEGKTPSQLARFAAIGAGASLAVSALLDFRRGFRNLVRADVMALAAFYFLTLFEFLFRQSEFDVMTALPSTRHAISIVLLGLAGLLIGRHLFRPKRQPLAQTLTKQVPIGWMLLLFWSALVIGFSYMLIAVQFDFVLMIEYFMAPRFMQPWTRGKFGDWRALLYELNMLIYLVPPLGGVIMANRKRYGKVQTFLVALGVLFTFFYGFTSGTRNIFASHLVTFVIGYAFALPSQRRKELLPLSIGAAVVMLSATVLMLKFRTIGLADYLAGEEVVAAPFEQTLFVDYNLLAIARLTEIFPKQHPFLGWEVPYQALIRPIPRAIWPSKPEGLSLTLEDAMGVEGMTIAASFAGEAFMAGGLVAVLLMGLVFGAITGWWSHLWSSRNSELGVLIYASGFFAAVISMRSLFAFTTAILPSIAAIVATTFVVKQVRTQAERWLRRLAPTGPPARPKSPTMRQRR